jgi:hypothetical protein
LFFVGFLIFLSPYLIQARLHDDTAGKTLKEELSSIRPVIVPIFDGIKALSPSMRKWLESNFPGFLDDLDGPSAPGKVDVRVDCAKWWYYSDDLMPVEEEKEEGEEDGGRPPITPGLAGLLGGKVDPYNCERTNHAGDEVLHRLVLSHRHVSHDGVSFGKSASLGAGLSMRSSIPDEFNPDQILYFNLVPIIKRQNHRKHNSHQWFFDSICEALDTKVHFAFLTDCGTSYNVTCLARLVYELYFKNDLIGVTARQRVETPNLFFHPCEDTPFSLLKNDHTEMGDARPCWRCWAAFFLSPAPLQGFEFEATLIMNSAMFNLVEALPVMPGPCQLLNWRKMKRFKVVDEYFNLLFKGESTKKIPKLPKRYRTMSRPSSIASPVPPSGKKSPTNNKNNNNKSPSDQEEQSNFNPILSSSNDSASPQITPHSKSNSESDIETGHSPVSIAKKEKEKKKKFDPHAPVAVFTFTEFLRVNMRLAEDRILSFVCVFSTGYGTKWIPGKIMLNNIRSISQIKFFF